MAAESTPSSPGETSPPLAGRSCGTCGLCCKLLAIQSLGKPENQWCRHYRQGTGCSIHGSHPDECRTFYCGWMRRSELGEEWRPTKSRMVLYWIKGGKRLVVHVDPNFPGAWRKAPYFQAFKLWSQQITKGFEIVVRVRDTLIVILPNKEVDLGRVEDGDLVFIGEARTPVGTDFVAERIAAKDATPEMRARATPLVDLPR